MTELEPNLKLKNLLNEIKCETGVFGIFHYEIMKDTTQK
jgi:hypothetical protein